MNQSVTPYHHGDLRNCAIIAAAELIESIGSYDITIAQVAKRVGVSSPALYRHFKDKDALLTAVRELAHIGIMEYTTDAQESVAPGTLAHIDALGSAYLRFAMDKKAFFGLMWKTMETPMSEELKRVRSEPGFRCFTKQSSSTCESNVRVCRNVVTDCNVVMVCRAWHCHAATQPLARHL